MMKDHARLLDRYARTSTQHKRCHLAFNLAVKALVSTVCLVAASCCLPPHPPIDFAGMSPEERSRQGPKAAAKAFRCFAAEMDKVARQLEEWGTLTISAPVISHQKKQFKFDLDLSERELYNENRTEGAVSLRVARAVNVGISVDVKKLVDNIIGNLAAMEETDDSGEQLTLKTQIVGAMRKLAGSPEGQAAITGLVSGRPELVGLVNAVLGVASAEKNDNSTAKEGDDGGADDEGETGDDADAGDSSDDTDVMESTPTESLGEQTSESANAAAKDVGEFSEMLGTFDSSKLAGINPRRHIRLTASDFWELNLHKFFSMPENLVGNFKPVFVTFTVACQPGWRTREGYAGVVDARVEFMYEDQRVSKPLSEHPSGRSILPVAGVYPAYDSQELNLRNSRRELQTFAAQLAGAGELAAAKVFLEAAERREQDAETNTGIATVTGYSHGGQGFGYEFRPTFRALERPGHLKTKPGFRLEPISFPAVAIALVDVEWLGTKVEKEILQQEGDEIRERVETELGAKLKREVAEDFEKQVRVKLGASISLVESVLEQSEQDIEQKHLRDDYSDEQWQTLVDQRAKEIADAMVAEEVTNRLGSAEGQRMVKAGVDAAVARRVKQLMNNVELVFQITHTWRPLNPPLAANIPLLHHLGRLFQFRLSESDFAERLVALGLAYEHFNETFCKEYNYENGALPKPEANQYACEILRRRWAMLASQAVNFKSRYKLKTGDFDDPKPKPSKAPTIKSISPTVGWRNAETLVVIQGKGFQEKKKDASGNTTIVDWVKNVVIGGVHCKHETIGLTTIVATVVPNSFDRSELKHDVTVVTEYGSATVPKAIEFVTKEKRPTGEPAITVTRDGEGRITVITINADAMEEGRDADLLKAIRAILENENCCDNVQINVKCTAKKSGT